MSALSLAAHFGLQTQMNDLGNADQAVWRASTGDWRMMVSNDAYGEIRSRLGLHWNLVFLPLAALYLIWPDPCALLLLNTLSCALAAVGLHSIARLRLGVTWWTLVPPLAFLASPMVHDANLYDFHVTTLMAALIVWSIWAFERDRPLIAYPLLASALLCKEDAPVIGVMLAVTLWLTGRRRHGLVVATLSIVYLALVAVVLTPLADPGSPPQAVAGRYEWLTGQDPLTIATALLQPDRLRLPLYLLASGALVGWRGWRWFPLLLPHLGMGMLSGTLWMTRVTGTYYWILSEAVIVLACTDAAARARAAGRKTAFWPLTGLGVASLVFSFALSPLPHAVNGTWQSFRVDGSYQTLRQLADMIPAAASLSVQNNLGPHLSQREDVASFPRRSDSAGWVMLRIGYWAGPSSGLFVRSTPRFSHGMDLEALIGAARGLILSPEWGTRAVTEGFYVFQRGAADTIRDDEALRLLGADAETALTRYLSATDHLSPVAAVTVGRLSWSDLATGAPLLRPGSLPGDPVGFRRRVEAQQTRSAHDR